MAVFEITLCLDENITVPVDFDGTPTVGAIFSASGSTGELICGVVGTSSGGTATYTAATEYNSCIECLNVITPILTANTAYNQCEVCWDASGYTTSVVPPPHPVWTGNYGETIIEASMVQLGGRNGLNA